jgi:hypothetical protein
MAMEFAETAVLAAADDSCQADPAGRFFHIRTKERVSG